MFAENSRSAGEAQDGLLLLAAVGLYDHEFAPGLPVVGLLASPREVHTGNIRVRGARVRVGGHRLFEGVDD